MNGRTLAIGDVHGCHTALVTLIDKLALEPDDQIVFLGDAVDRGPDSKKVVDSILELNNLCQVIFLMGNHEEMMRNAIAGTGLIDQWLRAGGQATLESYGGSLEQVHPEHIRFLVSGKNYWEDDCNIYVHANLESSISLPNQVSEFLRWKHLGGEEPPHYSGKRVICGHTSQTDGVPLVMDGWVCIDTYPHGGKWLTCLDVETNQVTQASQGGDIREFPLDRYS